MNGFSADWLALREPADRRARNPELLARLRAFFAERHGIAIVDLGCGAGSNLRACAPELPRRQDWTLVDHDPALLRAARARLAEWAERSDDADDQLRLEADGKELQVRFLETDLAKRAAQALDGSPDLVTAAAVFDLVSPEWISGFVAEVARTGAAFYTALNYNGVKRWMPAHPADPAILAAFHAHQARDKGFGPAAGPHATELLAQAFQAHGYDVRTAISPWRLDVASAALVKEIVHAAAKAVRETGLVSAATVRAWLDARLAGATCEIGHADLLATPPQG
jgi:SAM-dependent methyltransferase